MLQHCWLGVRKSIRPEKKLIDEVLVWLVICLEPGADCLHMVQLMPLHPQTPSALASFKSRLVLPFWYRLTQVVTEKRPVNGSSSGSMGAEYCDERVCVCVCLSVIISSELHVLSSPIFNACYMWPRLGPHLAA